MEEINLLQNRLKDTSYTRQRQSRFLLTFLWLVLIAAIGAGAMFYFLDRSVSAQVSELDAENQKLQLDLTNKQASLNDAKTFQAQLANIKTLLDDHIYLTPMVDELSRMTYVKAKYLSMDAQVKNKIHLEGLVPSYNDLGKLLLGLETSGKFHGIKLMSVRPAGGLINGFDFDLELLAEPEIYTKK